MPDDVLGSLKDQLEYMFIKKIIQGLRDKSVSVADAKAYAQTFLAMEPFTSLEDAQAKVEAFSADRPLFADEVEYTKAFVKEQQTGAVIEEMRAHLRNNDIDKALEVAQGA